MQQESMGKIELSLPSEQYFSPEAYREEMDTFFHNRWIAIGRADEIEHPADFITRQIGDRSIVVTKNKSGDLRAFYNTCRHRGATLCSAPHGKLKGAFICPYHAWSFDLDGNLRGTPNMKTAENFDRKDYPLYSVAVDVWEGFLFANLGDKPAPLDLEFSMKREAEQFKNYGTAQLKTAARLEYDVDCNWKLIVENFSECYHCPGVHPEWCEVMPRMKRGSAIPHVPEEYHPEKYKGGSALAEGYRTLNWTGQTNRPQFKGLDEIQRKIIIGTVAYPNLLLSFQPDYVHSQRIMPTGPTSTHMVYEWYFDIETMAMPDFDPSDVVDMWDLVNQQDFGACILAQRGLQNPAHKASLYVPQERGLHAFNEYIREGLRSHHKR